MPKGPKGRFAPFVPFFWGIWNFSKNQSAAKSLIVRLSQPDAVEKMVVASGGYDLPSFANFTDLQGMGGGGAAPGTLSHYPNPYDHQVLSIAGAPAPHKYRRADRRPGAADPDGGAPFQGRGDRKDARLGVPRTRRLHAQLRLIRSRHRRCRSAPMPSGRTPKISVVSTEGPLDFARGKLRPERRDLFLHNKPLFVETRSLHSALRARDDGNRIRSPRPWKCGPAMR